MHVCVCVCVVRIFIGLVLLVLNPLCAESGSLIPTRQQGFGFNANFSQQKELNH